jgi:hypothetical protein
MRNSGAGLVAVGLIIVLAAAAAAGYFVAGGFTATSDRLTTLTIYISGVGGILGAAGAGVTALFGARNARRREAYRGRIGEIVDNMDDVSNIPAVDPEELRVASYIRQRDTAERELAPYLSANPRRAKRLINHERLYGRISEQRRIFGGNPDLTYAHLKKWILIVENWPRLGAAMTRDSSIIGPLENSADVASLQNTLNDAIPGVNSSDSLFKLLREEPKLSPVLARLVRFEPAGKAPVPNGTREAAV